MRPVHPYKMCALWIGPCRGAAQRSFSPRLGSLPIFFPKTLHFLRAQHSSRSARDPPLTTMIYLFVCRLAGQGWGQRPGGNARRHGAAGGAGTAGSEWAGGQAWQAWVQVSALFAVIPGICKLLDLVLLQTVEHFSCSALTTLSFSATRGAPGVGKPGVVGATGPAGEQERKR